LEILDQLMRGIEAARRPREALAMEREVRAEHLAARRLLPRRRVVGNEVANLAQGGRLRMPQAATGEATAGLDVQVERRRNHLASPLVREARAGPALVWRLVAGE